MSFIHEGKIVVAGTEDEFVPGFSLRMEFITETSKKFVLFEIVGEVAPGARGPQDMPSDCRWSLFWCYGRIKKNKSTEQMPRKLLNSNVDLGSCISTIRNAVRRECKGYVAVHPPTWWVEDVPDMHQVDVMLAKGVDDEKGLAKLDSLYDDDNYILELKYDGHRAKAHFTNDGPVPKVRFDSRRRSDVTGFFSENTDQLPHLSGENMDWSYQGFVTAASGIVLDGEIVHPKGIYAVGSVMGASADKAVAFQKENGWAKYYVFDAIYAKHKSITSYPWHERRTLLEQTVLAWRTYLPDPSMVEIAPYWEGKSKRAVREWAFANGYEGTILKNRFSKYFEGARTWDWVKDKKQKRFTCIVLGYEDSQSDAYGPKGWIKNIKVGQHKDGAWIEVASVGTMDNEVRQLFSENKVKMTGAVVEIEAQEQNKATNQLRHPRFVCFRTDKTHNDAFIGQEG